MPRFSIRQLLAATALVGLGCLALVKSSALVAAATTGAVALILVAAVVLAIYRSESSRAFWTGFAIFGWSYLVLSYGPIFSENSGPFGGRMVTARLSTALFNSMHDSPPVQQPTFFYTTTATAVPYSNTVPPPPTMAIAPRPTPAYRFQIASATGPDLADFLSVAHCLWAVLIAFCGGWFAVWASRSRRREGVGRGPAATAFPPDQ
jgi:hypothetical protein